MSETREKHQDCVPLRVLLWNKSKSTWHQDQIRPTDFYSTEESSKPHPLLRTNSHVVVIFADADKVRDCPSCQRCFTDQFQMPELWWAKYTKRSNGYFGCETFRDDQGKVTALNTWSRFLVKQLSETYHQWYKFNVFTRWIASSRKTFLLAFESPKQFKLAESFPNLLDGSHRAPLNDPFWVHVRLLEELARLQDIAVWTIRNGVRTAEREREPRGKPDPDYDRLHDLAKDAIHVHETLNVSEKTVSSMVHHHNTFMEDALFGGRLGRADFRYVHERLLWYEHIIQSLQCRASSNKERLLNEIQLTFNTVTQYDSRISVQIGRATQTDSAAMKTIAFATLAFLPATFISAVFSTSFFKIDEGTGKWGVSDKFWVYWAFAIPVTIATSGLWYLWQRAFPPAMIGEEEQSAEKLKSPFWEETFDSRGLLGGRQGV
ncbi:Hypothetical protein NCS54_00986700 [Fusarium falciforme]|uniref:Hypothetical protein n=1 Tax=Fusarium falciforme TaxID=195108 RepID=UPI0022FFCCD4|nr:Hypothetical protein NCS54_00986700 [Fusarium falciforme]WAO92361.1 Hypothetical protein NCS54_00986700 [Fusarium falciforme]